MSNPRRTAEGSTAIEVLATEVATLRRRIEAAERRQAGRTSPGRWVELANVDNGGTGTLTLTVPAGLVGQFSEYRLRIISPQNSDGTTSVCMRVNGEGSTATTMRSSLHVIANATVDTDAAADGNAAGLLGRCATVAGTLVEVRMFPTVGAYSAGDGVSLSWLAETFQNGTPTGWPARLSAQGRWQPGTPADLTSLLVGHSTASSPGLLSGFTSTCRAVLSGLRTA